MTRQYWMAINFLTFYLIVLLFTAFQTSFIYHFWTPKIMIFINLIVILYVIVTRPIVEGMTFTVISSSQIALQSTLLDSLSVLIMVCLYLAIRFFRAVINSTGHVNFIYTVVATVFLYQVLDSVFSVFLELGPPRIHLFFWTISALLTGAVTKPILSMCNWIDIFTKKIGTFETPSDSYESI